MLAGWQNSLQQLQRRQHLLPKIEQTKPIQHTQRMQPSTSASRKQEEEEEGCHDFEDVTVPFDGAHLLECHGMTQYDTLLNLEMFLQQLQWSAVAPVVRYLQYN